MSKVLSTMATIFALSIGLAAMGTGPALATNDRDHHPWAQTSTQPGYAGPIPVYVRESHYDRVGDARWASSSVGPWEFVPGGGIVGGRHALQQRIND
jgi:hypothetical protein